MPSIRSPLKWKKIFSNTPNSNQVYLCKRVNRGKITLPDGSEILDRRKILLSTRIWSGKRWLNEAGIIEEYAELPDENSSEWLPLEFAEQGWTPNRKTLLLQTGFIKWTDVLLHPGYRVAQWDVDRQGWLVYCRNRHSRQDPSKSWIPVEGKESSILGWISL